MLRKFGEAVTISSDNLHSVEKIAQDESLDIENRMAKFAQELKVIAPQAKDFLYFTAVMMHAAEAACVNDDGSPKKLSNGEIVTAHWEPVGDGVKWVSNDPNLKPYRNSNCFLPGTDILMSDGSNKKIEDVQIGDSVITHDGTVGIVTKTFITPHDGEILKIRVKNKPALFVTKEHPFFAIPNVANKKLSKIKESKASFEWIQAQELSTRDILTSPIVGNNKNINPFYGNKTLHKITSIVKKKYSGNVYNFEVEGNHSYIANGIAVHNCDIFPEPELKIAYKNWVGRPLCLDHQSQSVDKIRGVIVDTVYDDKRKRVIALCALDAKNYSDLADKVKTGVANNVSMGTAVGRAVCTECYKAARTERDFCQHMRTRNRYGEVNLDLSPIELSLVVQGADPKAKVKHIIASDIAKAAGLLTDYLQLKEAARNVSTHDLESIKKDLEKLTERIDTMSRNSSEKDDESDAVGPTHSKWSMDTDVVNSPSTQINAPEAFPTYASELQQAILGAQTKLASLQENLLRLEIKNDEEPTMTKKNAYYQGTEEPTPGQKQYPVDPLNDKARLMDKSLLGPAPFPGVGDIEGSYPGDEQTKKELQRLADEHERAMFREAALKKAKEQLLAKGYFQGTTDPKPGQITYKPDPLNAKAREEDKTLIGKKPFPGVGNIEGLYGDDMSEKEKLSRASLRARFEKVAQPDGRIDKGASRWVVFADERPILAATVNQITKGNSDALYPAVASARFGKSLLDRIQTEGFHATASALLKSAQGAPPPPPPPPPASPAPAAPPTEPVDNLEPPDTVGDEAGDPEIIVDDLGDLTEELRAKLDQLKDKVSGPVAEDAEGLEGIAPAGDDEFAPPSGEVAPKSASQLQSMRKRVNAMLQEGVDETITALAKHIRELNSATRVYKEAYASMNTKQRDQLNTLTISAVKDARAMLADTDKLMSAVVKYARGTAELEKRAAAEARFKKSAQVVFPADTIKGNVPSSKNDADDNDLDIREILDEIEDETKDEGENEETLLAELGLGDAEVADVNVPPQAIETEGGETVINTDKLTSKAARAQARVKLAQKGLLGFNELSDQAHPGGSVSAVNAGNLDVKPATPGAAFHVQKDLKDAMLELANMPPHVRKQAEMIQQLVSEGRMSAEHVDQLVKHNVDADAVKYWKAMWGEAKDPEASEFASKLTQEHAQVKKAEQAEAERGRIKRAYQMANEMFIKGLISETQIDAQASDIMNYNDHGFESLKRIIAKQPAIKQASVPNVGLLSSGEVILPAAQSSTQANGSDIKGFFDSYFTQKGLKF